MSTNCQFTVTTMEPTSIKDNYHNEYFVESNEDSSIALSVPEE